MNLLAHLYLSGHDADIRMGNFIGDYVKGNGLNGFTGGVRQGILLHRAIDAFTDSHPAARICSNLLREGYGRYSRVVADVIFDHFLAVDWGQYSASGLKPFTRHFYYQMVLRYNQLPPPVRRFLPFMIKSNRLYSYGTREGLGRALEIMSSVTSLPNRASYALDVLSENYSTMRSQFHLLFGDLIRTVQTEHGINLCHELHAN